MVVSPLMCSRATLTWLNASVPARSSWIHNLGGSAGCTMTHCCVKRAVTVVSPLMGSGATLASRSPQWTLVVGGCAVGSRATLTWINASVPARRNRKHCLGDSVKRTRIHCCVKRAVTVVSLLMGSGATLASRFPQWALVVGGCAVGSRATLTWINASVPARRSRKHCLGGSVKRARINCRVKRAVTVVSPLMRGGATLASRSPQWALVVGGCAVGSGATLTWLNVSIPARNSRINHLGGSVKRARVNCRVKRAVTVVSPLMRGGATLASRSPQWALVVGGCAVGSGATLTWLNVSIPARNSRINHLGGSVKRTRINCCVKRAVTVVSPLMGSGATLASGSPQWTLMVGGCAVGSRATLTWINASVPARSSRINHLGGSARGTMIHCLEGSARSTMICRLGGSARGTMIRLLGGSARGTMICRLGGSARGTMICRLGGSARGTMICCLGGSARGGWICRLGGSARGTMIRRVWRGGVFLLII